MINNYLERQIKENFPYQPTPEQEIAVKSFSEFLLSPRSEVVFMLRGYAGTGKTSLVGALVRTLDKLQQKSVLLAPTGRAAKVFSAYAGHPAFTIHKKIYRQQSFSNELSNFSVYQRGGLGDVKVKRFLNSIMQEILEPIRNRRKEFSKDIPAIYDMLQQGCEVAM